MMNSTSSVPLSINPVTNDKLQDQTAMSSANDAVAASRRSIKQPRLFEVAWEVANKVCTLKIWRFFRIHKR